MKIDKNFILKNIITICCAASLILLILPFGSVSASVSTVFGGANSSTNFSGFDAVFGKSSVLIAWLMVICPVVLVAMNYIKQLDKYKSLLAIILPVVSTVAAIATLFTAGTKASGGGAGVNVEIKTVPSIGFFLLLVAYIGTLVAGGMTFYGLKLSKEGLAEFRDKLKEEGAASINSLKEKGQKSENGTAVKEEKTGETAETSNGGAVLGGLKSMVKSNGNSKQPEEVLALIEKLATMKADGILTEEEFAEKKKELLAQI